MGDYSSDEKRLEEGFKSLLFEAELLREELEAISAFGNITLDDEDIIPNLRAISAGRVSTAIPVAQPFSVRERARMIMATPSLAQELLIEDFDTFVTWAQCQTPPMVPDILGDRLAKRKILLDAALPDTMARYSATALARINMDHLEKRFVNSETMLGDDVAAIPKENFFASEDNYAWDMDELAQAIAANNGVMRNPLSKQIFSDADIKMIISHPLGKRLKLLQEEQGRLKGGFRRTTIDMIGNLGKLMLSDQSADAGPSRQAIDEFLASTLTLPDSELKALNDLKIPGRDRNTGQAYDYTIGESVRDAKANITCFHKVMLVCSIYLST
jgi:hypothetical protein